MKTGNKVIAFLMAVVFMIGLMPGITPAQTPVDNRLDMPDVLSLAQEALESDGESTDGGWQYVVLRDYGWAVVTGYDGEAASDMAVPDMLGGYDTVGIAENALYDLKGVTSVQVPGNVFGIGQKAFPKGTTVKALNASPAQKWASKNRYAFQNASEFQFIEGVVDLSDTRIENFVRVSETEVWLRELESRRLSPGTVFFLPDPSNLYQISYYRIVSMSEPMDGFVTVMCETPDVDDVIYYLEATDEMMVVDPDSIVLYNGAELADFNNPRNLTHEQGHKSEIGLRLNMDVKLGPGKLKLKDSGFKTTYETSYKIGLLVENETEVKQTNEFRGSVSYEVSADTDEETKYTDILKEITKKNGAKRYPADLPLFSGVVVSIFGFFFINATIQLSVEISGNVTVTYSSKTVTTTKTKEGSSSETTSHEVSKSFSGKAEGEFKIGVKVTIELYASLFRIAALDIFIGLKATASLELINTYYSSKDGVNSGEIDQFLVLKYMLDKQQIIALPADININMIDCVKISINLVAEAKLKAGFEIPGSNINDNIHANAGATVFSGEKTLFDVNLNTLHFHLISNEYDQEPYDPAIWDQKDTFEYYHTDLEKDNFHFDYECPYDYKTVKEILPYANNKINKQNKRVAMGTEYSKPVVDDADCLAMGYRITGWYTDESLSKASKVKTWPVKIYKDTTFYAKAEKMHKITLIGADKNQFAGADAQVKESSSDDTYQDLSDAYNYVPNNGYINLPSETGSGAEVLYWIIVNSKTDLMPEYYSDENDDWKIQPGTNFKITDKMDDDIVFCAVTNSDIAAYFHTSIQGQTYIQYGARGGSMTAPACNVHLSHFVFAGWSDAAGNVMSETISIDINSPSTVHYYAMWNTSDVVEAVDIRNPHIGSVDPGYAGSFPDDPASDFTYKNESGKLTITGYTGNLAMLKIPEQIIINNQEYEVAKIGSGAFKNNTTLKAVILPKTIVSIGSEAFSGCTALELIVMDATSVAYIPYRFAYGCENLKCVRISGEYITAIGDYAFYGCTGIDSISLNSTVGSYAFSGCIGITAAVLGTGVTSIGSYAFSDCTGISVLKVPDSVSSLGNGFISGCTGITELTLEPHIGALTANQITIGENSALTKLTVGGIVTSLGEGTFANGEYGFTMLTSVTFQTILKSVGKNILKGSAVSELTISLPASGSISSNAFSGLAHLRKVTVESGRIGESMFQDNTSLEEVVIGAGVSSIGTSAFSGCTSLRSVTFIDPSLTSIGTYAFADCSSLTSLTIPDSVTSYGNGMISGCTGLKYLKIGGGAKELTAGYSSESYSSILNPFYIGEGSALETLVLGEGIIRIGAYVFGNSRQSVNRSIYTHGFSNLTIVELPSTLEYIGSQAFYGSAITELELGEGLASSSNVFKDFTTVTRVTVKGGAIGESAFSGCTNLQSITLMDGVTSIGKNAFMNCTSLTSLTIPDSVTSYGIGMISGCTGLKYLEIGGGVAELDAGYSSSMENMLLNPFYIGKDSALETLVLGEGITKISSYAFGNGIQRTRKSTTYGFKELTSVVLPSTLQSLGSQAFYRSNITEIDLGYGLASASESFKDFTTLTKVTVRGGAIGESAFSGCTNLKTVTLMEGVTSIGESAFYNCTSITSLEIPDSVTGYGSGMITGCTNLTYLKIGGGVTELDAGYVTYNDSVITNPFYIGQESVLETLVLGEGITSIGQYTFGNSRQRSSYSYGYAYGFKHLTKIVLPSTLESLGTKAFYRSKITEIDLAYGLASAYEAFKDFTTLTKVTIRGGAIGESAFSGCTNLESVTLMEGVTSIGKSAFYNCTSLTSLTIPDSVTSYGDGMITGCTGIRYLKVGGGVAELSAENAGENFDYKVLNPFYIGSESELETLVLGEGITKLGSYVFGNSRQSVNRSGYTHGFGQLKKVELPSTLESLGVQVFYRSKITELDLGYGLASPAEAFKNFTALTKVTVRGGAIGESAFYGCTNLKSVTLMEGVTSIGKTAFYNCTSLTSLIIPDSVTSYGDGMITGCTGIKYLKVGGGVAELSAGYNSYYDYWVLNPFYIGSKSELETLVLGEGITTLGAYVFGNSMQNIFRYSYTHGFSNLTKVVLPSTIQSIETGNISMWKKVPILVLPSGIESISDTALSGLTLYSDSYSSIIEAFAASKDISYFYADNSVLPSYKLTCVAPGAGIGTRGLAVSDGTMIVTRGLEGEETVLPEGYTILSEEEILLMDSVTVDDPPVLEGYAFYGWYTDPEYLTPWNLAVMPSADITLYARIEPLIHVRYAVNLASAGTADSSLPNGFVLYKEYYVEEYSDLPVPADPPVNNYALTDWYMDAGFVQNYLPAKVGTTDITIYGNLRRASSGASYKLVNGTYTLVKYTSEQDENPVVYIPSTYNGRAVTAIGAFAFMDSSTTEVHLPGTITNVNLQAFDYSSVVQLYVSRSNTVFSSYSGVLYNRDKSVLVKYPYARKNGSFVMPDTVVRIGEKAFAGNIYLRTVDFSDNLQEIGADAFNGCRSLTTVILPDTCSVIRSGAFESCYNIQRFEAYGITTIEQGSGETLPKMTAAVYGPVGSGVLRDWFLFEDDGKYYTLNYNQYKVELYIDGKLQKTIAAEAGFPLSSNILFEEDEESNMMVSSWYKDASFSEIWDMENDIMPEEEVKLYTSTSPVYTYETVTLDIDGTAVTGITLTGYNGTAKNLVIPASIAGQPVVAISESFLSTSCTVQNLTIGSHVLHIDDDAMAAFNGTLYCEAGSAAQEWAAGHSITVVIKQYTITFVVDNASVSPVSAETGVYLRLPAPLLGNMTFIGWFTDEEYTVPVELDEDGFYIMGSGDVTLYGAWAEAEEIDFEYEIEDSEIIITGYTGDEDAVVIPDTIIGLPVTKIADAAFADNEYVGTVTVPDSITEIGVSAFADCRYLSAVNLGSGISEIDNSWFYGCYDLSDINISASNADLCSVGGVVFNKAQTVLAAYPVGRSDTSYDIPNGITAIGDGAFENQRYLESVTIPSTVTAIGDGAFMGCTGLSGIEASSVVSIGDNAFMGCYRLESADFGENLETIGSFAFMGCESLASIYLPAGVTLDIDELYFSGSGLVITGHLGSSAYDYAMANSIMFIDPDATGVTEVALSETSVVLKRGDQLQLTAEILPADADFGTDITWYSSDSSVAVVDGDGLVAAIGGGTAEITAVSGNGVSASCEIEVYISTTGVNVTGMADRLWLLDGAKYLQLYAEVQPYNASFQDIIWSSSDELIATVNEAGLVTAVSPGTAIIYAMTTDPNGITGEYTVTVNSGDLSTMAMPAALTSIEDEAFLDNDSVEYVILGSAVAAIGANAFADMDSLELILIPASVTDIADTAFAGSYPVIICNEGSYAESYAMANGMEYINIQ